MREKWTERTFQFDLPVGRMPFVLERLRGTAVRMAEKTRDISSDHLHRRVGKTWSAQENIGHLLDLEDLHLARLDDFAAGLSALRPADMTNAKTWDANHNATPLSRLLEAFRTARSRFIGRIETWDPERHEFRATHPRLRVPMRVIDLAYFAAEHDDYHLARIHELLTQFRKECT